MLPSPIARHPLAILLLLSFTALPLRAQEPIKTAAVHRGDLAIVVGATGTLEPQRVVDVSSDVAGRIVEFGPDPRAASDPAYKGKTIDFGSSVEAGTLLARIDDAPYLISVERAKAAISRAQAESEQANARVELANVQLKHPEGKANAARTQHDDAEAEKKVAEAAVAVAKAALVQAKINLSEAQLQLDRTKIVSPIKGVIIDRRADLGQTVVASVSSSLFLIATDLKHLQLWASVNEADIAKIKKGQSAHFTCDAFPGKEFQAKVQQIRLNATMTKNVVTYTVTLSVEPTDVPLLPYLTAQVRIECDHRNNLLLVPTAALRWRPPERWISPQPDRNFDPKARKVWVREGKVFRAIEVYTGASGAGGTEITGGDLKEGDEVVISGNPAGS